MLYNNVSRVESLRWFLRGFLTGFLTGFLGGSREVKEKGILGVNRSSSQDHLYESASNQFNKMIISIELPMT